jgi:hypothetical protein
VMTPFVVSKVLIIVEFFCGTGFIVVVVFVVFSTIAKNQFTLLSEFNI